MKYFFTILFSLFVFTQSYTQTNPFINQIINDVSIDSLTKFVNELSGEVPVIVNGQTETITSRFYSSSTNDIAADYVKEKFESYGLTTFDQNFSSGRNVYAQQTGTTYPDQYYIFCAHYDDMPSSGLAPGADDNGSGTAAVIEAARVLKDYLSEYSIIYAVWDAEEIGLVGSSYYSDQASANNEDIKGVLNFDMIAYDSNNDNLAEIHTRNIANSNALKDSMVKVNNDYNIGINISIISPGIGASDHASFWDNNFGAILLIENYYGDFNAYYHSSNDLIDHFNLPYYLKNTQLGLGTLALLSGIQSAVPVELISFSGFYDNEIVKLKWTTATENNNYGFEVERKMGEQNSWQTIGFVEGNGSVTETSNYSFSDEYAFNNGKYFYRLKQIDFDGKFEYSNAVQIEVNEISTFALEQNYPNPFNPATIIKYSIPEKSNVNLTVYDLLGREVEQLVNCEKEAGNYEVRYNASGLTSGMYIYKLQADNYVKTRKMILTK